MVITIFNPFGHNFLIYLCLSRLKERIKMNILDKLNPVLRDMHRNFDFLLSKGYKIRTTDLRGRGMLFWSIVFESPKCLIHIYKATEEVFLAFAPLNAVDIYDRNRIGDLIDIHAMIFYLTN